MSDRERVEALAKVREAVEQGLRKCRVEDGAPVGLFRDADLFHISHMVSESLMQTPAMRDLLAEAKADALREAADALNTDDAALDVALLGVDYVIQRLRDRAANPYRETSKEPGDDVV